MSRNSIITENQLDEWVRSHAREAQGVIVELVYRLVAASVPKPRGRRFPLGDSIGQSGADGILLTDSSYDPFVPAGKSFWEIGTGAKARDKATSDYKSLTESTPDEVKLESAFVFVTPLSGIRGWPVGSQTTWKEKRGALNDWRDVRVTDGTRLIDWLFHFPAVELWLADKMGLPVEELQTPEQHWAILRTIGAPPLTPQVFLVNRDAACGRMKNIFTGIEHELRLDTRFPDQVPDFVAAYVAAMDDEATIDAVGRCMFISGTGGWNAVTTLTEPHTLVADFDILEADSAGARLVQSARNAGHAVIIGGIPGGMQSSDRVSIPSPKSYQIKEALEKAGYGEEHARTLAERSNGNLSVLLRCLQSVPPTPEWARGTDASELAISVLLGAWTEQSEADRTVAETISRRTYGEWIGKMREIALRPGTPLTQKDGTWKLTSRYEGWYALGPRLFDEHLDLLKEVSVSVLREQDPQFELSSDERFMANIRNKVPTHSRQLRIGLAETLALLGSHPQALTSCSSGKARAIADFTVREIFAEADWALWASLDRILPLLAEASPGEFLGAVENALARNPCPFDTVFAQEGSGIFGGNYTSGLLWALETLAWSATHLTRVVIILGELDARDPSGQYANRPANSLSTIFLPWLPQTCAPVSKRRDAVEILLKERSDTGWKLLLILLPSMHQSSSRTRRPAWREIIPEDWSDRPSPQEYWEQTDAYAELAITEAKKDLPRLSDLIDHLSDLPTQFRNQLIEHLSSDMVLSMPDKDRFPLWTKLVDLVSTHRKFSGANWAMPPHEVDKLAAVAEELEPSEMTYRYKRLFSEHEPNLYEEMGDYEEQCRKLQDRRQEAVKEILATEGVEAILEFSEMVESPWHVGIAFGAVVGNDADRGILPELLCTENKSFEQFARGFVLGRFRVKSWLWVDEVDTTEWTPTHKGQFLAYLPFTPDTWERSDRLLGEDDSEYWKRTNANPYEAEEGLALAVDHLVKHGRPLAAIGCLHRMKLGGQPLDSRQTAGTLLAALDSSEDPHTIDAHYIVGVIKTLQDDPDTDPDDLFRVEWAYLQVLDRYRGASPKSLERRLANDPGFFCEIIRIMYRSNNEEPPTAEPTVSEKNIVTNAYHLLHEWRTPPGTQEDGTYNEEELAAWLQDIKAACTKSGRLEVALRRVGHVLAYAPPDPDGLWIHHAAAATLNARDADDMRQGFRAELFNSRGVHGFSGGQEEMEIAEKYRKQADEVESAGYHRLATALKELAESYEREADREAASDPFDD